MTMCICVGVCVLMEGVCVCVCVCTHVFRGPACISCHYPNHHDHNKT